MGDLDHFSREVAAGSAMLQAGNVDAAIRHCKAALAIAPDHIDAYELQVDILRVRDRPEEALRVTHARLEHRPDCRWANLQQIRLHASMGRTGFAKQARDVTLDLFADDPMMQHDANFMYDAVLDRDRAVLKRIKAVRETGYWGIFNLSVLEQNARANSGHVHTLGKLQQQDLEAGAIDADTLHGLAVTRYLQGRLPSARKLASQAIEMEPQSRPLFAEIRFAATLGLIPLFWPAQAFITLTGSLTARFPWFIRIFTNYALALLCLALLGLLVGPVSLIPGVPEPVSDIIVGTITFANIGWGLYVIWALGSFGRWRMRKRNVSLSSDY